METETNLNQPDKERNSQKTIIYILGFLVIALSVGFIFMYLTINKIKKDQTNPISSPETKNSIIPGGNGMNNQLPPPVAIDPNGQTGAPLIGKIKEITSDKIKITLSVAFSDPTNSKKEDMEKEIEKTKIEVIKKLVKNPNFNEERANQIQETMRKKYEENKNAIMEVTEESKQLANDETLRPFAEEIISWEDLKVGNQVNYQQEMTGVEGDQKKVLVVLSDLPEATPKLVNSNVNVGEE